MPQGLRDAGTTFAALVDDARRERALGLLADRSRSVTEIAMTLGFGSVAGFTRAVRRWTGATSTAWRARPVGR